MNPISVAIPTSVGTKGLRPVALLEFLSTPTKTFIIATKIARVGHDFGWFLRISDIIIFTRIRCRHLRWRLADQTYSEQVRYDTLIERGQHLVKQTI